MKIADRHRVAGTFAACEVSSTMAGRPPAATLSASRRLAVVGALVGVSFAAGLMLMAPELSFSVDGVAFANADTGGWVRAAAEPRQVRLTDGSYVTVNAYGSARLQLASAAGPRVFLESGSARFAFGERPPSPWSVEAGPFTVYTSASQLDVSWAAPEMMFNVETLSGEAEVRGPLFERPLHLKAGQRLSVNLAQRDVLIRELGSADR